MSTISMLARVCFVITVTAVLGAQPSAPPSNASKGLISRLPDEVMPDTYLRFKVDPVKRAESQSFHRDRTVPDWRQAMPIGNGDFWAAVHGYPDNLTFHIGKNDLWWSNKDTKEGYPVGSKNSDDTPDSSAQEVTGFDLGGSCAAGGT